MAVRIAEVHEHRVSRPVASRSALDASAEAECARDIASVQEMVHFRRQIRDMMKTRTGAVEEDDVVRIALALQENAEQIRASRRRNVFGQAETRLHVHGARVAHPGREDLIVIEALRASTSV